MLMDSDEETRPLPCEPNSATAVPDLYEVFSTPYTKEDVARGVRAKQSIGRGVLVEVAHCIRIPKDEYEHHLRYSVLEHYLYVGRNGDMLLALGVGSLFNHSQKPNLNYTIDHDQLVIRYRAARAIAAHEELTITYGSSSKLWFEDKSVDSAESSGISMLHEYLDDENAFLGGLQLVFYQGLSKAARSRVTNDWKSLYYQVYAREQKLREKPYSLKDFNNPHQYLLPNFPLSKDVRMECQKPICT